MHTHIRASITRMPRPWKRVLLVSFDILALGFAVWAAYALRYGNLFRPTGQQVLLLAAAPLVAVPFFIRFGLYRAVIRYLPERAIWTILQAVSLAAVAWVLVVFLSEMSGVGTVPRSIPILYWAIAAVLIGGSRFAAKKLLWPFPSRPATAGQMLIYGAGEAGAQLATSLRTKGRRLLAGFIDDDPGLAGRDVAGLRVYPPSALEMLVTNMGVQEVVLSIPSLSAARRQQIVAELSRHALKIRTLPAITDLIAGKYLINQIREIDIDELLGRSTVPPDLALLRQMIEGRAILVTGAGGSIGSALCRLIARWAPRQLVLVEANEFALYNIEQELRGKTECPVIAVLASVADRASMDQVLRAHGIEAVLHAAAHKHVPLVEANALEGMRNNVFGTLAITQAAFAAGVQHFVLISSDKAVRPTNVMGATKRWAEFIVRHYAREAERANTGQQFCAVRFGNVLGSNGSVVPLFKQQIADGGPVTLTHPEMTRYFMSIHEAAELIVQAGALSEGGDVFLLEMGIPVRIQELAENMIRLAGFTVRDAANPGGDIEIAVTGIRPGEKMYEELFYEDASVAITAHPKILRASANSIARRDVMGAIAALEALLAARDEVAARQLLFDFIAERASRPEGATVTPLVSAKGTAR